MMRWRCRRFRPALVDLAGGALTRRGAARLERHLSRCQRCAGELAVLRSLPVTLRALPVPDPGDDFWDQQRQAIRRAVRQVPNPPQPLGLRFRPPLVAWVAAGALAVAIIGVHVSERFSTVPDVSGVAGTLDDQMLHDVTEVAGVLSVHTDVVGELANSGAFVSASTLEGLVGTFLHPLHPFPDDGRDDASHDSMG